MEGHEILVGAGFLIAVVASMAADSGANTDIALGAVLAGLALIILGGLAHLIKATKRRMRR